MRFSIIVPAYNLELYIEECINSVLSQVFGNYELLIINDGSTDNTFSIAKKFICQNVRVIDKKNGGLSSARNMGILESRGEYLIFLDGDDFWDNRFFLKDLNCIINNNNPDLIIFPLSHYYSSKNIKFYEFDSQFTTSLDFKNDFKNLVNFGIYTPSACNKCIKRSLIVNNSLYFPIGRLSEDIQWCAKLSENVNVYSLYNKQCYMYRQNRIGSITHKVSERNILHILHSIDEGLAEVSYNSNNIYKKNMEIYFSYSFIEIIPYINSCLNNKDVVLLLKKYRWLIRYGFDFKEKKKKLISYVASIFDFYISSVCLNLLVIVYRYLNRIRG